MFAMKSLCEPSEGCPLWIWGSLSRLSHHPVPTDCEISVAVQLWGADVS